MAERALSPWLQQHRLRSAAPKAAVLPGQHPDLSPPIVPVLCKEPLGSPLCPQCFTAPAPALTSPVSSWIYAPHEQPAQAASATPSPAADPEPSEQRGVTSPSPAPLQTKSGAFPPKSEILGIWDCRKTPTATTRWVEPELERTRWKTGCSCWFLPAAEAPHHRMPQHLVATIAAGTATLLHTQQTRLISPAAGQWL